MAPTGDLQLLNDRLNSTLISRSTTAVLGSNSPKIKIEEGVIDDAMNKFICAECGESYHKLNYLVHHYTRLHTQAGFVCPVADCGVPSPNLLRLTQHYNKKHGRPAVCQYPGCGRQCLTLPKLLQHLDTHSAEANKRGYYLCSYGRCQERFRDLTGLTQHAYQAHPGVSVASRCLECHKSFPTDQELCGHYRTIHPFPNTINLYCPAPDCSGRFLSTTDLYLHYQNARHPSFIPNQVPRHLAFKCPFGFCARAYSSEIGLGIHGALAHGPEIGGVRVVTIPSVNPAIGEGSNIPESLTNQQFASEHQVENPIERTPRDVESVIEIDGQGAILYQPLQSDLSIDVESEETADVISPLHKMRVGFILESQSNLNESGKGKRDEHGRDSISSHDDGETEFPNEALARGILQGTIHLLQANDNISVDELLELWHVFLQPDQRQYTIQQLKKINIHEDSETLIARLRGSVLGAVIAGWIGFKTLLNQTPPHLQDAVGRRPRSSGRDTAWAILMHCMLLESLRDRALPTVLELGYTRIPDRLRFPSKGYNLSGPNVTFAQILDALAERVQCIKALPESIQLTNAWF